MSKERPLAKMELSVDTLQRQSDLWGLNAVSREVLGGQVADLQY